MSQNKPVGLSVIMSDKRLITVKPNTPENLETLRKWLKIAHVHLKKDGLYIPPQHLERVETQLKELD